MPYLKKKEVVKWDGVITNIQANILSYLARYRYLTLSQLMKLNVGTTQYKYLWKQMASLRDRQQPLVKCQRFSVSKPLNGEPPKRIEDWYYLNNAGKKALVEELFYEGVIKMPPTRTSLPYKDYEHRRRTIDFQIQLDKWAKSEDMDIPFFDTYFDKVGNVRKDNNLRAKTRIELNGDTFFIPDGAFKIRCHQEEFFFLMEIYDGKDTNRTIQQIHKHASALTHRFTHRTYNIPVQNPYKIILVFELCSHLDALIKRVKEREKSFSIIQRYFCCKCVEQIQEEGFHKNWMTLEGDLVNLI